LKINICYLRIICIITNNTFVHKIYCVLIIRCRIFKCIFIVVILFCFSINLAVSSRCLLFVISLLFWFKSSISFWIPVGESLSWFSIICAFNLSIFCCISFIVFCILPFSSTMSIVISLVISSSNLFTLSILLGSFNLLLSSIVASVVFSFSTISWISCCLFLISNNLFFLSLLINVFIAFTSALLSVLIIYHYFYILLKDHLLI